MIPIALAIFLLFQVPQQPEIPPNSTRQQHIESAKARYEVMRQAAIRLNDLAANIHTEADARAFVDAVAEQVTGRSRLPWTTKAIRHRVAHAEFEAVSDPARLIPEQRIVDVWNEYVREINAPEESLATLAEIHNLRDAMVAGHRRMWERKQFQSIWIAPGIHATKADGSMAEGCRAVEALKIFHQLFSQPLLLLGARQRVKEGILLSDRLKLSGEPAQKDSIGHAVTVGFLRAGHMQSNPVLSAEIQYVRDHGQRDYDRLMMRLFEEFFPKE